MMELDHLGDLELVDQAIESSRYFKIVSRAFEGRAPSAPAAERLIAAWEAGEAPAWLTAHLLGRIGHDLGYGTVRTILLGGHGSGSGSYAGSAMGRIRGAAAEADLTTILRNSAARRVREGAAYGLAEIGLGIDAVLDAAADGQIPRGPAVVLLRARPDRCDLVGWFQGEERMRLLARDVLLDRKTAGHPPPNAAIQEAALAGS